MPSPRALTGTLLRHVEVRPQREAHPGNLRVRRPGKRGEQLGRPVERRCGNAVAAGRGGRRGRPRRPRRRARVDVRRAQRIGQPAEVRRRAEQPGDPRGTHLIGTARQHADPPESARPATQQLGMPLLKPPRLHRPLWKPIRRALRNPLPHPHILSQRPQLLLSHRLGNHQPPERAAPTPEQPLVKREPRPPLRPRAAAVTTLPARSEQPVTNPGDLPPATKLPQEPGKFICGKRRPPRPRGQRQHHLRGLVIHATDKRVPSSNNPNRPARSSPHPAKRHRPTVRPSDPRVIRRHECRDALRAARFRHLPRRPRIRMSVFPARDLTDEVPRQARERNIKAVKTSPAASHHDTSPPCPSPWA